MENLSSGIEAGEELEKREFIQNCEDFLNRLEEKKFENTTLSKKIKAYNIVKKFIYKNETEEHKIIIDELIAKRIQEFKELEKLDNKIFTKLQKPLKLFFQINTDKTPSEADILDLYNTLFNNLLEKNKRLSLPPTDIEKEIRTLLEQNVITLFYEINESENEKKYKKILAFLAEENPMFIEEYYCYQFEQNKQITGVGMKFLTARMSDGENKDILKNKLFTFFIEMLTEGPDWTIANNTFEIFSGVKFSEVEDKKLFSIYLNTKDLKN